MARPSKLVCNEKPEDLVKRCTDRCGTQPGFDTLVGDSESMQEVKRRVARIAPTEISVLITGETGTGKELIAEAIHTASIRHGKRFVCVNCAALPDSLVESELFGYARGAFTGAYSSRPGKFRHSNGGTLFLDEVGELTLFAQAKLLRTIETRQVEALGEEVNTQVDFRLISATNQLLEERVRDGFFRSDLYYRLNVARIHVPPLRDRIQDLPLLIRHYLPQLNREFGLEVEGAEDEAVAFLSRYSWPGNVRELKNVLETAYLNVQGPQIRLADLPAGLVELNLFKSHLSSSERDRLIAVLEEVSWNKSRAAEKLCWSRMKVYRKLAKYGLSSHALEHASSQ